MKQTINEYGFMQAFIDFGRKENFSPSALRALFDYYTDIEDGTGEEIELDVIGICCDWCEYDAEDLLLDYPDVLHIRPSHQAIGSLLALAIFGSTLAFMFYTSAVRAIGIARTSIFANLIPVVTAITSLIILREVIDLSRIVGMLIVISGLFMTQASGFRRWHRARKK